MASDLISRETVEKDMRDYADRTASCGHIELANGILKAVCRIAEAPAVDAVEVVRCKDCKHCFPARIPLCGAEGGLRPIPYNIETWYCPLGERKEDAVD